MISLDTGFSLATEAPVAIALVLRPNTPFNGLEVFTATLHTARNALGETITEWIAANPSLQVTEIVVAQSSDESFHCLTFVVFYSMTTLLIGSTASPAG